MGHQTSKLYRAVRSDAGIILQLDEGRVICLDPFQIQVSTQFDGGSVKCEEIITWKE